MSDSFFYTLVYVWIGTGIVLLPFLLKITVPYGRHTARNWGKLIDYKLGWVLMEVPSLMVFTVVFLYGDAPKDIVKWILFTLWTIHYLNRSFIYPFRTKTKNKKNPFLIIAFGIFFNLMNAFLNAYWLGYISPAYGAGWLTDPRFIVGIALFVAGFIINQDSDRRLLKLRQKPTNGYSIPYGGLFKYVSCPNFLGEMIQWIGFALMAWSLPAFSFALWTVINLLPRALDHHRWYKSHFSDYPTDRKALFPFII